MLINSPLAAEILATSNPAKIKFLNMAGFDGTSCLEEHIMAYKNSMLLYTMDPTLLCKFLPTTLTSVALIWYTSLPVGSINSFAQLEAMFLGHFCSLHKARKIELPPAQHNLVGRRIHIRILEEIS